ncbi:helix-turn-helix domain-containing protein [Paracoccus niistensis]
MEASLLEAAASVGLEGERISTPGMVLRLTGNMAIGEDARATEMALRILAVAKRPGDPFNMPIETIRRIEAAATPFGQPIDETDMLEDSELPRVVEAGRSWAHVPILAGWRAAANYAFRSRRTSPAAERLVFMTVEGAARHLRGLSPEGRGGWPEEDAADRAILMPAEAGWIVAPSVALTRNGFRLWSPLSGLGTFLEAATRSLSQDLGHLGTLRHELARLQSKTTAASGRSRLPDLVELLKAQPVVNSAMVIDRLGVTRRTALALIGELVEAGCLVNLTGRRTARFWALPSLAARMTPAASARQFRRTEHPATAAQDSKDALEIEARLRRLREQFDEERLDRIMSDLDAAMAGLNEVVRKAGGPQGQTE